MQVAKDIEFNDPLEDVDPIMEQAFSVNNDETEPFLVPDSESETEAKSSAENDTYDFYEDEDTDSTFYESESLDVDEIDGQGPKVSDIQFPTLDDKTPGKAFGASVFSSIPVSVSVELGRSRVSLKEVFELSEGSIIELERMVGEPLDLVVNGQVVAHGEVVAIDNNYGLRVTNIVTPS